ncbi:lipase/esterase family protein [Aspergillus clavatus NRRL 1]|uniref:Lipase/esterase family protein n=1 Tax=Aspergillus clavatus (strain ATCC 1007 / CBS 513.65 / DSM 816 / NCTC 3887 / NRRL 1 / QM 1276 / 107) TaxID=344612 RepID=A1CTH5_ASPCL|nr:lipase/esterase family protein [Aspergillus clavatus NRRL 1]EAW06612.1 lipase/esterase family protein [Aspergillus clavatus NRRL 1]
MPLNTVALGAALTPTVVATLFSHFLHRKSRQSKPTVHISYDEGIQIIREFLTYASKHPVEDLQAFTAQRVPAPHWVKTDKVTISENHLSSAATTIINQLGSKGVSRVGGEKWWQWRGPSDGLKGEWIEMKKDYNERKRAKGDYPSQKRIMLYIHGGAYFFGTEYRLAPQFPFPCALQDCLAAYLYLLDEHDPKNIIFAGDSAGGGMVLSILVILRDQGLPLPAGAILISPWVDLTHSFPSVVSDCPGDYIPPNGFRHKPSAAWPPPNADEIEAMRKSAGKSSSKSVVEQILLNKNSEAHETAVKGYSVEQGGPEAMEPAFPGTQATIHDGCGNIKIPIEGKTIELKDQIQMYVTNQLISHPLVSPVLQPSLGGLPPLQILVGGGERLRDEQFYLAHKAANPTAYSPSNAFLDQYDPTREILHKYPGTYVQLQVWDDLCHVTPALSFTRPAKYMYRSIAQFGAWALACAQTSGIDIIDDDEISPISSTDTDGPSAATKGVQKQNTDISTASVGRAGDPLPSFRDRMIRQRVDKRGHIYPLEPPASYAVLQRSKSHIGTMNPHLVTKWISSKQEWDIKFAKAKLRVQRQRLKELAHGFQDFEGETPPPSSLAARRLAPGVIPAEKARMGRKSYPMTMWSRIASKHDERTLERERQLGDRSRRKSVECGRAGESMGKEKPENRIESFPTEQPSGSDVQKQPTSDAQGLALVDAGITSHKISKQEPIDAAGNLSEDEPSRQDTLSIGKSSNPLILLPEYESRQFTRENASTTTLLHAAGTLPATSDNQRPASQAGSGTVRSVLTADLEETSTIDDQRSLALTTTTGLDNASTRAVRNSKGVVSLMNHGNSTNDSVDAFSAARRSGDLDSFYSINANTEGDAYSYIGRPDMPDRDVFKTADEYH